MPRRRPDRSPRALRPAPGSVIGEGYCVVRLIGRGSMGAVYEATELGTGMQRALKVMAPDLIDDERALYRFEREARLGARIPSTGVVHTLAAGTDEASGLKWIAMEYVAGQSLEEWLATGPPTSQVRSAIEQLLRAVAAAHALGVIHRDLKPGNIMIVREPGSEPGAPQMPLLKVLDFGVAKSLHSHTASSTQEGLGTPMWTAPEQGKHHHLPAANADLWALGLLVFWLLTGKMYWLSANRRQAPLAEMVLELVSRPLPAASARAAELGCVERIPRGFDAWFARCTNRDPTARFDNAGAALDALAPILGLRARRAGLWSRMRTLHRASPAVVTACALLFVALALAVGILLARRVGLF
jgi:serine/threonine protein kinase